jgi:hypothetical protein
MRQSLSQTQCTVPREGANLQHPTRLNHAADHRQQSALQVPTDHVCLPMVRMGMCLYLRQ